MMRTFKRKKWHLDVSVAFERVAKNFGTWEALMHFEKVICPLLLSHTILGAKIRVTPIAFFVLVQFWRAESHETGLFHSILSKNIPQLH